MLKIGIVGVGGMGTVHYSNYAEINEAEVVAVVGKTEADKNKAEKWGFEIYPSITSLLEEEEIDIVDVCTPTFLHKEHVMEALAAGKDVIVEKPVALHKKDAEEMFALAEEKGSLLFVGQVLQFTKEVEILQEAVKSGQYGQVLDAYFQRLSARPGWVQGSWLFEKEKSGLLPFDLHIHDLDLIISLFGKPRDFNYTAAGRTGSKFKEHYRFTYHFRDFNVGAEAAWYNANYPFTASWRVYFEEGLMVNTKENLFFYPAEGEPLKFDTRDEPVIPTGINLPPTAMFYNELTHFLECVQDGQPSERVSKEQVITTVEILEEIVFS